MTTAGEINSTNQHVCPHRFAFMLDNWFRKLFQNPRRIVGEFIQEGDTVIDLGCGPGFFTVEMAKLVGEKGSVIAVDLQEEMLAAVRRKAARSGVSHRLAFHRCDADAIGLDRRVDFILAFYMLHETPDAKKTLQELKQMLKPGGRILVVEPKFHVSKAKFASMRQVAERLGYRVVGSPSKKGGWAMLLSK